jgi:hypothetical protein
MARRRLYNLPFDVLECDACGERSPLEVPLGALADWLTVSVDDTATHFCPDCRAAAAPPLRAPAHMARSHNSCFLWISATAR